MILFIYFIVLNNLKESAQNIRLCFNRTTHLSTIQQQDVLLHKNCAFVSYQIQFRLQTHIHNANKISFWQRQRTMKRGAENNFSAVYPSSQLSKGPIALHMTALSTMQEQAFLLSFDASLIGPFDVKGTNQ